MINLLEEIDKVKRNGYNEANAQARIIYKYLCSSNESIAWCVTDKNDCLYRRQNEAFIYTLDIFYALGHRGSF